MLHSLISKGTHNSAFDVSLHFPQFTTPISKNTHKTELFHMHIYDYVSHASALEKARLLKANLILTRPYAYFIAHI